MLNVRMTLQLLTQELFTSQMSRGPLTLTLSSENAVEKKSESPTNSSSHCVVLGHCLEPGTVCRRTGYYSMIRIVPSPYTFCSSLSFTSEACSEYEKPNLHSNS